MVDPEGDYLFHRRMQVPLLYHTWTCHLSTLSCATFFRRRVFFNRGFRFDESYRASGDGEWMVVCSEQEFAWTCCVGLRRPSA
jgi:hypothetical protein